MGRMAQSYRRIDRPAVPFAKRLARAALAGLAALALLAAPGSGQARDGMLPVDLELVIAVDVSVSMDIDDQLLQRKGFIEAFQHPRVISAIQHGRHGRIAVAYMEWSGPYLQWVRVPWTVVSGPESARAFARAIDSAWFRRRHITSMSAALLFASGMFQDNGFDSPRQVIDISGDGPNNDGGPVDEARDRVVAKGITINGLPIMHPPGEPLGFFEIRYLDTYYRECVIGGAGAFIHPVRGQGEILDGVRRKLVLEIAGARPSRPRVMPVQFAHRGRSGIDCQVGERRLRQWWESEEHE